MASVPSSRSTAPVAVVSRRRPAASGRDGERDAGQQLGQVVRRGGRARRVRDGVGVQVLAEGDDPGAVGGADGARHPAGEPVGLGEPVRAVLAIGRVAEAPYLLQPVRRRAVGRPRRLGEDPAATVPGVLRRCRHRSRGLRRRGQGACRVTTVARMTLTGRVVAVVAAVLVLAACGSAAEPAAPAVRIDLPAGSEAQVLAVTGGSVLVGVRRDGRPGLLRRAPDGTVAELPVRPSTGYGATASWYALTGRRRRPRARARR